MSELIDIFGLTSENDNPLIVANSLIATDEISIELVLNFIVLFEDYVDDFDEKKLLPPNLEEEKLRERIASAVMNFRKSNDEPPRKKSKNLESSNM